MTIYGLFPNPIFKEFQISKYERTLRMTESVRSLIFKILLFCHFIIIFVAVDVVVIVTVVFLFNLNINLKLVN